MAIQDDARTADGSGRRVRGATGGAVTRGVNKQSSTRVVQPTTPRIGGDAGPRRRSGRRG